MKTFEFNAMFGGKEKGYMVENRYANNGNLAIQIMTYDGEMTEPYCMLTTNIVDFKDKNLITIDTNSLYCDVVEVLEREGVIENMHDIIPSGFCTYPVYRVTDKFKDWL